MGLHEALPQGSGTSSPPQEGRLPEVILPREWWKEYYLPDLVDQLDTRYKALYANCAIAAMVNCQTPDLRLRMPLELVDISNRAMQAWTEKQTEHSVVINGIVHPAAKILRSYGFRIAAAPVVNEIESEVCYSDLYLYTTQVPFAPSRFMRIGLVVGALNEQARSPIPPQNRQQFRRYTSVQQPQRFY